MKNDLETKEKILKVALRLFSQNGYNETSIRKLAKESSVNLASINYYFKNKLGLYKACFHSLGQESLQIIEKLDITPASREHTENIIREFISEIIDLYVRNPSLILLTITEMRKKVLVGNFVGENHIMLIYKKLEIFFQSQIDSGIISDNLDARIVAGAIFGNVFNAINFDEVQLEKLNISLRTDEDYRKKYSSQLAYLYTYGLNYKGEDKCQ